MEKEQVRKWKFVMGKTLTLGLGTACGMAIGRRLYSGHPDTAFGYTLNFATVLLTAFACSWWIWYRREAGYWEAKYKELKEKA